LQNLNYQLFLLEWSVPP